MDSIIYDIVKWKTPVYFISPHLDDAILSAGGLIEYLSNRTNVTLVTVFTNPGPKPYSLLVWKFMRECGFTDADKLFDQRREEDQAICKKLYIKYMHLGFTDGAWRKSGHASKIIQLTGKLIPDALSLYPLTFNHKRIHNEDKHLIDKVYEKLFSLLPQKNIVIFAPMAIGNHVDHIITRDAAKKLKAKSIFWQDYPYSLKTAPNSNETGKLYTWPVDRIKKESLIRMYSSQIPALFKNGRIDLTDEKYRI